MPRIDLTDAEFDALPEGQRFLLEQVMARHPKTVRVTPQFVASHRDTGEADQQKQEAATNSMGGLKIRFDPHKRFQ